MPSASLRYYGTVRPAVAVPTLAYPDNLAGLYFCSNAVPAVRGNGTRHPRTARLGPLQLDRHPAARLNYLQSTNYYVSSRVHLFRQRIPIRNVDPLAYQ